MTDFGSFDSDVLRSVVGNPNHSFLLGFVVTDFVISMRNFGDVFSGIRKHVLYLVWLSQISGVSIGNVTDVFSGIRTHILYLIFAVADFCSFDC